MGVQHATARKSQRKRFYRMSRFHLGAARARVYTLSPEVLAYVRRKKCAVPLLCCIRTGHVSFNQLFDGLFFIH